ncbi:hypothetical protein [Desulfuribacillus alkaliarsenatis]|uniref:hypothetical protein n=1 Tax=Desulfuribacillus alkaliarsenatis TaxID=766136 RepID=UPI00159F049F|nr:hypothetical protein [Desulfuribacillus alkaliarsenatis]
MKTIRGCLLLMEKKKIPIIFFPFYLIYIFVFYMLLGVSNDIWDDVLKKIDKNK